MRHFRPFLFYEFTKAYYDEPQHEKKSGSNIFEFEQF